MRYIVFLFLFWIVANGFVGVDENFGEVYIKNEIGYVTVSSSENMNPIDILRNTNLNQAHTTNLGFLEDKTTWSKVDIQNKSSKDMTIYLYNPGVLMDVVDIYIFSNNILESINQLGDSRPLENRKIFSRFNTIKLNLKPNQVYTIISKISNPHGRTEIGLIAMDEAYYWKFLTQDLVVWGFILSGIILLFLFQIFFYRTFKNRYFLFYMSISVIVFLYLIGSNGFFYLLFGSSNFNDLMVPIFGYGILLFYILFIDNLLEIQKTKIEQIIFWFLYFYAFVLMIGGLSAVFSNKFVTFDNYFFVISTSIVIWLIYFSFKAVLKTKTEITPYYLFGQLFVLFGYGFQALVGMGLLDVKSYNQQILGLCVLIEMFLFSYAISDRIRISIKQKTKSQKLLMLQSNFASIGKTIRNISHQWKLPLARLGTLVTQANTIVKFENIQSKELSDALSNMETSLGFLYQTVDDFKKFYQNNDDWKNINLCEAVEQIKILLVEKISNANATIICENSSNIIIAERAFVHIAMILIDNFLDIALERKLNNPTINIYTNFDNMQYKIIFQDNCGGISQKPISSIFDVGVSSSDSKDRGNGLTIAKLLVEDKLGGRIFVSNEQNGASFCIIIHDMKEC